MRSLSYWRAPSPTARPLLDTFSTLVSRAKGAIGTVHLPGGAFMALLTRESTRETTRESTLSAVTREEIQNLLQNPGRPCVSIYMPTFRAGVETQQNPIRLKNLLRSVQE